MLYTCAGLYHNTRALVAKNDGKLKIQCAMHGMLRKERNIRAAYADVPDLHHNVFVAGGGHLNVTIRELLVAHQINTSFFMGFSSTFQHCIQLGAAANACRCAVKLNGDGCRRVGVPTAVLKILSVHQSRNKSGRKIVSGSRSVLALTR